MSLKSLVYKREYTYGEGDGGAGLEDAILAVDAQIQALSNQAALDTARVSAAQAGVFSGQVDGYEGLLTPEMLSSLTPADLTSLANQRPQGRWQCHREAGDQRPVVFRLSAVRARRRAPE